MEPTASDGHTPRRKPQLSPVATRTTRYVSGSPDGPQWSMRQPPMLPLLSASRSSSGEAHSQRAQEERTAWGWAVEHRSAARECRCVVCGIGLGNIVDSRVRAVQPVGLLIARRLGRWRSQTARRRPGGQTHVSQDALTDTSSFNQCDHRHRTGTSWADQYILGVRPLHQFGPLQSAPALGVVGPIVPVAERACGTCANGTCSSPQGQRCAGRAAPTRCRLPRGRVSPGDAHSGGNWRLRPSSFTAPCTWGMASLTKDRRSRRKRALHRWDDPNLLPGDCSYGIMLRWCSQ